MVEAGECCGWREGFAVLVNVEGAAGVGVGCVGVAAEGRLLPMLVPAGGDVSLGDGLVA